jgi:hypothetical protein
MINIVKYLPEGRGISVPQRATTSMGLSADEVVGRRSSSVVRGGQ